MHLIAAHSRNQSEVAILLILFLRDGSRKYDQLDGKFGTSYAPPRTSAHLVIAQRWAIRFSHFFLAVTDVSEKAVDIKIITLIHYHLSICSSNNKEVPIPERQIHTPNQVN